MADKKTQPYFFTVKNLSDQEISNFDIFSDTDDRIILLYGYKHINFEQFTNALANGMECVIDKTEIVSNDPSFPMIHLAQEFEGVEEKETCEPLVYDNRKLTAYFDNEYLLSLDKDEKLHFVIEKLLPYQELDFFLYPKKIEDRKITPETPASEEPISTIVKTELSKHPINLIVKSEDELIDYEILDANANFIEGRKHMMYGSNLITYTQFLRNICFDKKQIGKIVIVQVEKYSDSKVIFDIETKDIYGNMVCRPIVIDMEKYEPEPGTVFYVGEMDYEFILSDLTSMCFQSLQPMTKICLFPVIKK